MRWFFGLLIAAAFTIPSQLRYNANVTGSVSRPIASKLGDVVSVLDFGAVGNTVADDTAAIQAAHDALPALGGIIYFPRTAGYYNITSTIAFTKPVRLLGDNWAAAQIGSSVASLTWITTTNQIVTENMAFTAVGAAINTCIFIKQLAASAGHSGSMLKNSYFNGANKAYWGQRTLQLHVIDSKFVGGAYGLYLENATSSDEGDNFISNNEFENTTSGVYLASTSGVYIWGNKFNAAANCHIDILSGTGGGSTNTGDFVIGNNSIENHTTCGIRVAGAATTTKTLITGNQISGANATNIIVGAGAQNTTIIGNVINSSASSNGIAIDLQAGAKNVTITGNAFHQILTAIQATTNVIGVTMSGNRFADDVTNYWSGEDGNNGLVSPFAPSNKEMSATRWITNASTVTYVDALKVKGSAIVEIEVIGVVQGVGNTHKYRRILVSNGSTITDAIAEITVGTNFDMQVAAAGGYAVISVRLNAAAGGTNLTVMVIARVIGYPSGFIHA